MMLRALPLALPAALSAVLALGLPGMAMAQDIAANATPGLEVETDVAPLTVVERWQADRTQVFDAAEVDMAALLYVARPLIVFADSPNDPLFRQQLDLIAERVEDLAARDVILIADTRPDPPSEARLALRPRGFGLVLLSKDGAVAQRKPSPWSVREIGHAIDKMPLRQQEIRAGG